MMRSKELVHIQYVVNETSIVCSEKMSARQSDCSYQNLSDKIIKFPTAALTNDCICCALPKKVINTHVCFFNTNAVVHTEPHVGKTGRGSENNGIRR